MLSSISPARSAAAQARGPAGDAGSAELPAVGTGALESGDAFPVSSVDVPVLGAASGLSEAEDGEAADGDGDDDDGEADDAVSSPSDAQPLTTSAAPSTAAVSGHDFEGEKDIFADNNFRDRVFIRSPCPQGGRGVN